MAHPLCIESDYHPSASIARPGGRRKRIEDQGSTILLPFLDPGSAIPDPFSGPASRTGVDGGAPVVRGHSQSLAFAELQYW